MNKVTTLSSSSPFMTVAQAAELIGCSTHHIYVMCQRGELKHARFGNALRINKAALLEQAGLTEADYIAAVTAEEATPAAVAVAG